MLYFFPSMLFSKCYAAKTSFNSFKSSRRWFEFRTSWVTNTAVIN